MTQGTSMMDHKLVSAARRAVAAAMEANEAAHADDLTPTAVKGPLERVLQESNAVLEAAETSSRRRQTFAEFTTLLGEEIQEAAEESMSEATKAAERTLRQAKSLIEDHFHIDEAFRMLGPIRQDSNLARDMHDWFNLVALLPVIYLNLRNWCCVTFSVSLLKNTILEKSVVGMWHGEVFQEFWWTTLAYFILDILWVLLLPDCVKSPGVILKHHLATVGYIFIPKLRPEHGWLMGACMIVEVNTWFLIARRALNKRGDRMFTTGVTFWKSIRTATISGCFYLSWFVIRLVIYPYLLIVITREWIKESNRVGTPLNLIAITPVMQCVFIFLNMKWTVDLIRSKLKGRGASKGL
mmetsp:Transcript_68818/g.108513  ORF Transcript_68818/g.108513 Transcript_68818/m.108513 type:complete len:353 (+) Transcript_68818:62-1120(+)